jgi:hypothetical protein
MLGPRFKARSAIGSETASRCRPRAPVTHPGDPTLPTPATATRSVGAGQPLAKTAAEHPALPDTAPRPSSYRAKTSWVTSHLQSGPTGNGRQPRRCRPWRVPRANAGLPEGARRGDNPSGVDGSRSFTARRTVARDCPRRPAETTMASVLHTSTARTAVSIAGDESPALGHALHAFCQGSLCTSWRTHGTAPAGALARDPLQPVAA